MIHRPLRLLIGAVSSAHPASGLPAIANSDMADERRALHAEGLHGRSTGHSMKGIQSATQALRPAQSIFGRRDPRTLTALTRLDEFFFARNLHCEAGQSFEEVLQPRTGSARRPRLPAGIGRCGAACLVGVIALLAGLWAATGAEGQTRAEIVVQSGHSEGTSVLSISPDGRIVASGSRDGTVKLWTSDRLLLLRTLHGRSGPVGALAFTDDGRLVAGYRNGTLIAWEAATGRKLREHKLHDGEVEALAILSKDRLLSAARDGTVRLWSLSDGRAAPVHRRKTARYSQLAVAPDRRSYAVVADDGTVALGRLGRGGASTVRSLSDVRSIGWSGQGRLLVARWKGDLLGWNTRTGEVSWRIPAPTGGVGAAPLFSHDGGRAIMADNHGTLTIVDLIRLTKTERPAHTDFVSALAFDAGDSRIFTVGNDDVMRMWRADAGELLAEASARPGTILAVAASQGSRLLVSADSQGMLAMWDQRGGEKLRSFRFARGWMVEASVTVSTDGAVAMTSARQLSLEDTVTSVWSLRDGSVLADETGESTTAGAMDPARSILVTFGRAVTISDARTHRRLREAPGIGAVTTAAFLPDGSSVATAGTDDRIRLVSVATGGVEREFRSRTRAVAALAVSGDGRILVIGGYDNRVEFWRLDSLGPLGTVIAHGEPVTAVAASKDGLLALSASRDGTVKVWDVAAGRPLSAFTGHTSNVLSVAFLEDERFAASAGLDGAIRVWAVRTGTEVAALVPGSAGDWISVTPEGFFRESARRSVAPVHIVRGLEITTINQVRQSLFNPDLVREALGGDPDGEVRRAAAVVNIDEVLASGPAPEVSILSSGAVDDAMPGTITAEAVIVDRGKSVGRIEWRVNGVTASVRPGPDGDGPRYAIKQVLALDPGENVIELVAYNRSNLLASQPARTTITWQGDTTVKGRLHVLAIGIDAYHDTRFGRLKNAVNDAKALGQAFAAAAGDLYDGVDVEYALDEDVTPAKLDGLIDRIAARIGPRDTFVLFAAGHGTSEEGRFYLIPYGFRSDAPGRLDDKAIGQDRLQDWIGNRIAARRALILLDTCASGALVGGFAVSRTHAPASEAAVGRLHEATGRPVLTAAASGRAALEGYRKHGIFTWAILDALEHGDRNGNGVIEVSELAAHVQALTPDLSESARTLPPSLDEARGALALAGSRVELRSSYRQSARLGSTGEDFALAKPPLRDHPRN